MHHLTFGFHTLRPGVVQGTRNDGAFTRDGPGAWADSNGFAHKGLVSLRNTTLAARPQSISEGWMTMGAKRTPPFQPHHKRWPFKRKRYRRASTCIPHLSESDRCGIKLTRSGAHVLVCFEGNWGCIGAKENETSATNTQIVPASTAEISFLHNFVLLFDFHPPPGQTAASM